jgi:hypothetical protein
MDWATTPGALALLAIASATIFGVLYWLILLVADSKAAAPESVWLVCSRSNASACFSPPA